MSTTITFIERAVMGAVTSGAEITLSVFDRSFGEASGSRLSELRSALEGEDVQLENLVHGSWAWVFVGPAVLGVIATAIFASIPAAIGGAILVALLAQVKAPEVTATLRVRCRSLAALDRCLEIARKTKSVTVGGVSPTSDASPAERDGERYARALKRAEEMSARAGLRVTELVSWEELGSPGLQVPPTYSTPARAMRTSVGEGLSDMPLAPDPTAVRFVFRAEPL